MDFYEFRTKFKNKFQQAGIEIRDVDIILSLHLNKSVPSLALIDEIDDKTAKELIFVFNERLNHKPISKIFNKAYFYGLELVVDDNVLSPRPETELLVEKAIEVATSFEHCDILDLCTGSGAIACAIKKNVKANVDAVDISKKALKIAKQNASNLNLDINFVESDMFLNLSKQYDVIVSNPPYIETDVCKTLDDEVKLYDPIIALDGGVDGLDFYKQIKHNIGFLKEDGVLLLEIGYNQGEKIKELFKEFEVEIFKDYNNLDRVVVIKRKR